MTNQPSLLAGLEDEPTRRPVFALSGHGWAVPDQALSPFPIPHWDLAIRAANDALLEGADDRLALRHFIDATRTAKGTNEATAALDLHVYRMKLRTHPPKPPWPPTSLVHVGPR